MASLSVRNLSNETYESLRRRAAAAGRSMEAEARALIDSAVREPAVKQYRASSMSEAERKRFIETLRQQRLARSGGRVLPDSTPLIRRDRESR